MLEQAIVDATALREAAIKSAEQSLIDKFSSNIKEAVDNILNSEEEMLFEEEQQVEDAAPTADQDMEHVVEINKQLDNKEDKGYAFMQEDSDHPEMINLKFDSILEEVKKMEEEGILEKTELTEEVDISDKLIDQLVEEIMVEGGKVQQAKELSDDDEAGDDDIKVKSVSKVVIVKDDDEMEMEEKEEALKEEVELEALEDDIKDLTTEDEEIEINEEDLEAAIKEALNDESISEAVRFPHKEQKSGWLNSPDGLRAEQHLTDELAAMFERHNEKLEMEAKELKKENKELKNKNNQLVEKVNTHSKKNKELKETVDLLKTKFNEAQTLNAKLLYINKVAMDVSLNERQKNKIVESINSADSAHRAKMIYETLQSGVGSSNNRKPESLSEVVSEHSSTSILLKAREDKKDLNETKVNSFSERMKILAGIKHHKED
tara:strand:+ start:1384 stop:2685 length:1302 start_codon:yes stop_codon:yes gene_type:complete